MCVRNLVQFPMSLRLPEIENAQKVLLERLKMSERRLAFDLCVSAIRCNLRCRFVSPTYKLKENASGEY